MKKISRNEVVFSFEPNLELAEEIDPGELIQVSVRDGFNEAIKSSNDSLDNLDWDKMAPSTGPIGIKGAEPGDTLKIEVKNIELDAQGAMVTIPEAGCFGDRINESSTRIVPIIDNKAIFRDDIKLSLNPMIGVMGTMPANETIDTGNPGNHGGNMDIKKLGEDSILYLPVFEKKAKLALGDMHAVMGDGEVSICGVEIGGEVTLKIDLIKNKQRKWPYLETEHHWYVITSKENIDNAINEGLDALYYFIADKTNLNQEEIISLISIAGEVEICQLVNPRKTVRVGISKESITNFSVQF